MSFLSNADDFLVARAFMPISDALDRNGVGRMASARIGYGLAVALQFASTGAEISSGRGAFFPVMGAAFTVLLVAGIVGRGGTRRAPAAVSLRAFVVAIAALGLPMSFAAAALDAALPFAGGLTSSAIGAIAPIDLLGGLQAAALLCGLYLQACADDEGRR
jgi:hypothetical protein